MQNPLSFYDDFDGGVFEVSKPSKRCQTLLRSTSRPDESSLNSINLNVSNFKRKWSVPEVRIFEEGENNFPVTLAAGVRTRTGLKILFNSENLISAPILSVKTDSWAVFLIKVTVRQLLSLRPHF